MKSKLLILIVFLLLISACSNKNQREEILVERYEEAYENLSSQDKFAGLSDYYKVEVVASKTDDGKFRVDLILDQAEIAMYNIEIMMEINPTGLLQFDQVLPSLGIVDDLKYNLIPNQVNTDNGFYEGLVLSGLSDKASGQVSIMVKWTNYTATKVFEEFISLEYNEEINTEVDDNDE